MDTASARDGGADGGAQGGVACVRGGGEGGWFLGGEGEFGHPGPGPGRRRPSARRWEILRACERALDVLDLFDVAADINGRLGESQGPFWGRPSNLDSDTLSEEIEPFLLRCEFIVRTPRGRGKMGKGALSGIHPQELLAQTLNELALPLVKRAHADEHDPLGVDRGQRPVAVGHPEARRRAIHPAA